MPSISEFIHLHCHTEYSLLDGMPKVEEYILKVSNLGMPAIAITEHGNLRSTLQLAKTSTGEFSYKKLAERTSGETIKIDPIKPIYGIEFYVSPLDYRTKGSPQSLKDKIKRQVKGRKEYNKALREAEYELGYRKRYHMLAFAKNEIGMKNILTLSYLSFRDGFYYRPRVDWELIKKYHEGLVITTACIGGIVPSLVIRDTGDTWKEAESWIKEAKKIFKDDIYLEIQPHNIPEQNKANVALEYLADEFKLKTIATNDCHYIEKEHSETHNVLLAINSGKDLMAADAWRFDDAEFYLKDRKEMYNTFRRNHPALSKRFISSSLNNTLEIAEKCNFNFVLDKKKGLLPSADILLPEGEDYTVKQYVIELCKKGWKWRGIDERAKVYADKHNITHNEALVAYKERLKFELKRIFKMHFDSYFLIIWDLINWCRENHIQVGPGRGSSSGSLVSFLLGITMIDPLAYDLLFDRFLSEQRIDYPDIDVDFQDDRRSEVIDYLEEKYGTERCSRIGNIGTMKSKSTLLDVGRVHGVPPNETHAINKHMIERSSGDARASETIVDSFEEFDIFKEYDKRHPEVKRHAVILEGKARQVGIHASGVIVAPSKIFEMVPIEYRNVGKDKEWKKVTAYDYRDIELYGLVKMDVLGLNTLTVLKRCLENIERRHGKRILLDEIPLEDRGTLDMFEQGRFQGVFQFDSVGMTNTCKGSKFDSFEDVIAFNALYRPGAMRSGLANHYIKRKLGIEKIKKVHPIYDDITKETQGILIYQEQLIRCFVKLADFHPQTADEIRKSVAKSHGNEEIRAQKKNFVSGAVKNGMKKKEARKLFDNMAFFGSYAFNKSHAAAYGAIAYWCMYLKLYYPIEFYHSLMRYTSDADEIIRFVKDCRASGVDVKMPDINHSSQHFSIHGDDIYTGLIDINGVGEKAAAEISNEGNRPYTSLSDFLSKVNRRVVHRGVLRSLVKAGALGSIYPNQKALLREVTIKPTNKRKKKIERKSVVEWMMDYPKKEKSLYRHFNTSEFTEEEKVTVMGEVCPIPPYKHKIEYYRDILDNVSSVYRPTSIRDITEAEHPQKFAAIAGIVIDRRYNNVGDFHKEEPESDEEKKRIGWGKRYASLTVEDETGTMRVNIPINIFPSFHKILDKGLQIPIYLFGTTFRRDNSTILTVCLISDLDSLRSGFRKLKDADVGSRDEISEKLDLFEQHITFNQLEHPSIKYATASPRASTSKVDCVILKVKEHYTKGKDKRMAFITMANESGVYDVTVWADIYNKYYSKFKQGNLVRVLLYKENKSVFVSSKGKSIALLKKRYLPYKPW